MNKKVLICEDDKSVRKILVSKATESGFDVVSVENGSDAVPTFLKEKPDIILLDIIMPGKSGFEVLEEIRVKHQSKVPVIIITNLDQKADLEMAQNLVIIDYVIKSDISLRNLMLKIHSVLSEQK